MWRDEIVEEIHRIREEYAKSFNYDLDAIFVDLRKKQADSGREVVSFSRKSEGLIARWSGRKKVIADDTKDTSQTST
ncbi:hypothetical protein [Calothrix sp. 336/3]|uniref:hypothetical protein n=1 Tax=Calothrix sp. 336/3 TaxID=1337936 RepID=UPI0004E3BA9E|nr:hypothetical protein [Calothrix sp. 336/3]AKG20817.1 hypothetical protein IJ00_05395 [Calothrix sp. 336/3]